MVSYGCLGDLGQHTGTMQEVAPGILQAMALSVLHLAVDALVGLSTLVSSLAWQKFLPWRCTVLDPHVVCCLSTCHLTSFGGADATLAAGIPEEEWGAGAHCCRSSPPHSARDFRG